MKQEAEKTVQSPDSDTTTEGVRIEAAAQYLPEESDPDAPLFFYVYRIAITNMGEQRIRLHSRHWRIHDSNNEMEEVVGDGVVGEFPELAPGEAFQYRSCCTLRTRWGTMEGSYLFEGEAGREFRAGIGRFFLVPSAPPIPQSLHD